MDAEEYSNAAKNAPRLRYDRDTIFALKKDALAVELNVDESLLKAGASSIQKSGRGKSRSILLKPTGDRLREGNNIILGPQKRTWNTGCHVTHSELSAHRKVAEVRGKDRYPSRGLSDLRHDYRSNGRERGVRKPDTGRFSRSRTEDRHQRTTHYDEEPEWFSEGPSNITETIELGRILDDDDVENALNRSEISSPISSSEVVMETKCQPSFPNPDVPTSDSLSPKGSPVAPPVESQGSRFRYLFPKSDIGPDKKTNVNDQLLELLKGSPGSNVVDTQKQNVIQVENKLRSLLLGHAISNADRQSQKSFPKVEVSKPKILTVEEIEANLNLPTNTTANLLPVEKQNATDNSKSSIQTGEAAISVLTTPASNLAPVMNSFASQQLLCGKPLQVQNQMRPLGIIPSPMTRLPPSTNALSASARITQLQHADPVVSKDLSDACHQDNMHFWDSRGMSESTTSRLTHHPHLVKSIVPICMNAPPGLGDINYRTGSLSNAAVGPNMASMSVPRRPIVKAQQMVSVSQGTPLSQLSNNSHGTSFGEPVHTHELDRRFFDYPYKQEFQSSSEVLGSGDKPHFGSLFAHSDEFRFSSSSIPNPNQPINSLLTSNNNNAGLHSFPSKLHSIKPRTENTLAFLSQLVEMDRSSVSSVGRTKATPSFNHLLSPGSQVKTLEEIENG